MKKLFFYKSIFFLLISFYGYSQCNLDSIGLPPTQSEIDNVFLEWSIRDHNVYNWQIISDEIIDSSRIIVASHEIEGFVQYGLIRLPADTNLLSCPLPVMLYLHGGLNGVYLYKINFLDNFFPTGLLRDSMIIVAPAFRSEKLYINSTTQYIPLGPSSEMDKDADDAITFLNGAIENFSQIDTTRISIFGLSRGGNVAYKVAIRSTLIKGINVLFGASNIFDPVLLADSKNATLTNTSPQYILNNIVVSEAMYPYCYGSLSLEDARNRMIKWSPAFYAESLPPTNAFHGTLDQAIPISQTYFFDSVMNLVNPVNSNYHFYEFPNGGHSLSSISGFEVYAISLIRDIASPPLYYENDSLSSNGESPYYQWYLNGTTIPGETNKSLYPVLSGQYQLSFISDEGCSYSSKNYDWIITGNDEIIEQKPDNQLFFNSTEQEINHKTSNNELISEINLIDINGKLLLKRKGIVSYPYSLKSLNLRSGVYFFTTINIKGTETIKLFIL